MKRRSKLKKSLPKRKLSFDETKLGYLLSRTAPLEYSLILEASGDCAPSADLIEAVGYASLDPIFKTAKFRHALMDYRKFGLRPARRTGATVDKELKYISYRKRRAAEERGK